MRFRWALTAAGIEKPPAGCFRRRYSPKFVHQNTLATFRTVGVSLIPASLHDPTVARCVFLHASLRGRLPVLHFPAAVNEISHIRREDNLTLREMRDRANLSCTQVGKELFVDQSCVRHWEYGDWAPARKYYKKMAKLYGVSEEDIKAAAEAIRAANKEER